MRARHGEAGDDRVRLSDDVERAGGDAVAHNRVSRCRVEHVARERDARSPFGGVVLLNVRLAVAVGITQRDDADLVGLATATALHVDEYIAVGRHDDVSRAGQPFGEYGGAETLR